MVGFIQHFVDVAGQDISKDMCLLLKVQKMKSITTLTEKRFFEWHEDDRSVTLRARGGILRERLGSPRYLLYQDRIGALCATDYKWVQQEQVEQGKLIVCVKQ